MSKRKKQSANLNIVLQPDFFIPENWSSSVDSKEDEIAFRHYKSDIRKMGINASNYTNYDEMLFNCLIYNYPSTLSVEDINDLKNIKEDSLKKQII